jgi:hypothetical protein
MGGKHRPTWAKKLQTNSRIIGGLLGVVLGAGMSSLFVCLEVSLLGRERYHLSVPFFDFDVYRYLRSAIPDGPSLYFLF